MRGAAYLSTMWQFICPELLKAVATEPEAELKSEHMHSLAQCIQRMGRGCLTTEQTQELTRTLDRTLTEHFERQAARLAQRADEDYDEVVEEALEDEDEQDVYVLSKVSDVMHALFGTHKEAALPLFDQLLPHFTKLIVCTSFPLSLLPLLIHLLLSFFSRGLTGHGQISSGQSVSLMTS